MIAGEEHQLFLAAKQAQLSRNQAAQIIMADTSHSVLQGAFVRVLLELPDQTENYVVARVGAVTTGELYGGFANNANLRTDKYLLLLLPPSLATINGTQYQLNSISNSLMTEKEFETWLGMTRVNAHMALMVNATNREGGDSQMGGPNCCIPTKQELLAIGERIHTVGAQVSAAHGFSNPAGRQQRPANGQQNAYPETQLHQGDWVMPDMPMSVARRSGTNGVASRSAVPSNGYGGIIFKAPAATQPNNNNNSNGENGQDNTASVPSGTEDGVNVGASTPRPPSSKGQAHASQPTSEQNLDLPSRHQVRQDVLNKLNQHSVVFPQNIDELKLSQLRLTERDMIEYLEHVRDVLSSKQENCVVCLDHVPTVISLPCRHKVLCRLCASAVTTCPVCRSYLFELFEPKEI
uniref:WGS project CAEQ00000000 data, annotated contig 984 n=1 Tax=Trypanosoma congolense (strain IL3000) TaxID=1068625 RepID=F9WK44_TRYCI|nr:unnamed protein product [Trypanosoma congolense IL3000]